VQITIGLIWAPSWHPWQGCDGDHYECRRARGTGRVLYIGVTDYSGTPRKRLDRTLDYPFYKIPVIIEEEERGRFDRLQYDHEGCPDPVRQISHHYIGRTETGVPIKISEVDRRGADDTTVRMYATDRDSAPDRQALMAELGALTYDEYRELEKAREAA
jgi:hypothetical protein